MGTGTQRIVIVVCTTAIISMMAYLLFDAMTPQTSAQKQPRVDTPKAPQPEQPKVGTPNAPQPEQSKDVLQPIKNRLVA